MTGSAKESRTVITLCLVGFDTFESRGEEMFIVDTGSGFRAGFTCKSAYVRALVERALKEQGVTAQEGDEHEREFALDATTLHQAIDEVCRLLSGFRIIDIAYCLERGSKKEQFTVFVDYPLSGTLTFNVDGHDLTGEAQVAAAIDALKSVADCEHATPRLHTQPESFDVCLTAGLAPSEYPATIIALVEAFPPPNAK
ncbi:MAG TPA: hypothetical protein VLA88_00765 [Candidatus Saccharimonadales bacterium]|nr:hypothetical protein [Candidatus Saccharimonadales bacterium]